MPSPFFVQIPNQWKFYCQIDWDKLETLLEYQCVVEDMKNKWGINKKAWPNPCCGAKFVPYARGASKVIELRMGNGTWACILAERLPENLDDEIKKVMYHWHVAEQRLTPEDIMNAIPKTLPMINKTNTSGVSRFPIADWMKLGEPTLTKGGWVALCRLIASKDEVNLAHLITMCDNHKDKQVGDSTKWQIVQSKM